MGVKGACTVLCLLGLIGGLAEAVRQNSASAEAGPSRMKREAQPSPWYGNNGGWSGASAGSGFGWGGTGGGSGFQWAPSIFGPDSPSLFNNNFGVSGRQYSPFRNSFPFSHNPNDLHRIIQQQILESQARQHAFQSQLQRQIEEQIALAEQQQQQQQQQQQSGVGPSVYSWSQSSTYPSGNFHTNGGVTAQATSSIVADPNMVEGRWNHGGSNSYDNNNGQRFFEVNNRLGYGTPSHGQRYPYPANNGAYWEYGTGYPSGGNPGFSNSFSESQEGDSNSASSGTFVGPEGGDSFAEINPAPPGVESRLGGPVPKPKGNHVSVFSSSTSRRTIGPDGKVHAANDAVTGYNNNGKVAVYRAHYP